MRTAWNRMRKNLRNIALLAVLACVSCVNDEFSAPSTGEDTREVTLSLDCVLPKPIEIVVQTKSYTESCEAMESRLKDLYIYIFSAESKTLTGFKHLDASQLSIYQTDDSGDYQGYKYMVGNIKAQTGRSYICAVANLATSAYNLSQADLARLTTDIEAGGTAASRLTINDLYSVLYQRTPKYVDILDANMMFSGFLNNGEPVEIGHTAAGDYANLTAADGTALQDWQKEIHLSSIVSKNIVTIEGDNFTPQYYELKNIPLTGRLMPIPQRYTPQDPSSRYEDLPTVPLTSKEQLKDENGNALTNADGSPRMGVKFNFYLPQNLAGSGSDQITKWSDREKNSYDPAGTKSFDYAPEHSSYLVIYGRYSGAGADHDYGQVSYTIHLGDFGSGGNLRDYNVDRHVSYHYKVTVNAVDEIIVEAMTDEDHLNDWRRYWNEGSEGVIISPNALNPIHLDCHYEARAVSFNLKEAYEQIHGTTAQDGTVKEGYGGYIMRIDTFFDETPAMIVQDVNGVETIYDAAEWKAGQNLNPATVPTPLATINNDGSLNVSAGKTVFKGKNGQVALNDFGWIKILKNTDANIITGSVLNNNLQGTTTHDITDVCKYPANGNGCMNIFQFLHQLYLDSENSSKNGVNGGQGETDYYTFFFDENYYPNKTWDTYTNSINNRYLFLANRFFESLDDKSIYTEAKYVFEQECIWTFYDKNESGNVAAYGKEVTNEDEPFTNDSDYDLTHEQQAGDFNGRAAALGYQNNKSFTANNAKGKATVADANNKFASQDVYRKISQACMSRNRDENGDGKISGDEIKWYVPSVGQAVGLFVGDDIFAGPAKTFNRSGFDEIQRLYESNNHNADAAAAQFHYYTASPLKVFWAEEGASTSGSGASWNKAQKVRCIRTLESNGQGLKDPDLYYRVTGNEIELHVDAAALRAGQSAPLMPSFEREAPNKLSKVFEMASANVKTTIGGQTDKTWAYNATNAPLFEKITDGADDQCYKANNGAGGWRVPNMRELSLMKLAFWNQLEPSFNGFLWCNTSYTPSGDPSTYTFASNNNKTGFGLLKSGAMTVTLNDDAGNGHLRCVRDVIR